MIRFSLAFSFFAVVLFGQTHITFVMIGNGTVVQDIEKNIVSNTMYLFNKKGEEKFTYEIKEVGYFHNVFSELDNLSRTNRRNFIVGISSISITKEREKKYDFSSIYLPCKNVIFTLKENMNELWFSENVTVGYQKQTLQENHMKLIMKEYKVKPFVYNSFVERINALVSREIEFAIGDNVETWNDKRVKIVHVFDYQFSKGIGMMFPKGSTLKNKLDKVLSYYTKSSKFHVLIKDKFGKDVVDYFRKNL